MSLPSGHILPSSSFRHIGIMVLFMYYMAVFSMLGFLSVNDITRGWIEDMSDTLTLEIPAYDAMSEKVFDPSQMEQDAQKINNYLNRDPVVNRTETNHEDALQTGLEDMDIPAPYFITVYLNDNRAENAEDRLISNMKKMIPHLRVYQEAEWEQDIRHTAFVFQTVFCGLALSIFIVTSIILSGVIRTQLKANDETVKLVHLLGAQIGTIASLFKNSVTRAVLWGVGAGALLAAVSLSGLIVMLGLESHMMEFYAYLVLIALIFIGLCRLITRLTVISSLKAMP